MNKMSDEVEVAIAALVGLASGALLFWILLVLGLVRI
jgi:hypothetical protein